ncbi:MAG: hypothetical protein J2P23_01665 [Microlunatus sp.]|nr:hypothetical protein [Microlunatus sp.]
MIMVAAGEPKPYRARHGSGKLSEVKNCRVERRRQVLGALPELLTRHETAEQIVLRPVLRVGPPAWWLPATWRSGRRLWCCIGWRVSIPTVSNSTAGRLA